MKKIIFILGNDNKKKEMFLESKFPVVSLDILHKEVNSYKVASSMAEDRLIELLEEFDNVYFENDFTKKKVRENFITSLFEKAKYKDIEFEVEGVITNSPQSIINESLYNFKQEIFFNNDKYFNKENTKII